MACGTGVNGSVHLLDWSEPIATLGEDGDWLHALLPLWPALLAIVQAGDTISYDQWRGCTARFDEGPEPTTAEEANLRWRRLVACTWVAEEQCEVRRLRARAARRR